MAASVMLRNLQTNSKSKLLSSTLSCFELKTDISTSGRPYNAREVSLPEIQSIRPEGEEWGEMEPKVCWHWAHKRKLIKQFKHPRAKVNFLTDKKYKTWDFPAICVFPNAFDYQCGIAKTHVYANSLPEVYGTQVVDDSEFVKLKSYIIECLELENSMNRTKMTETLHKQILTSEFKTLKHIPYELSRIKIQTLLNNIFGILGHREELFDVSVDRDVTVQSCFHRHGVKRQKTLAKPKKRHFVLQDNAPFHGKHLVDFQIRKRTPLVEFLEFGSDGCRKEYPLVYSEYSPKMFGQFAEHVDRGISSGFNIGRPLDPYHFTHLSIVFMNKPTLQLVHNKYGDDCKLEAVKGYGLVNSFLSTMAQAHNRGYNMYEEVDRSITTQTLLTDGQTFQLAAYQLNTLELWKDDIANKTCNLMWLSEPMELYKGFKAGKIVGFNDDVLKLLLQSFLLPSRDIDPSEIHPYPSMIQQKEKIIVEEKEIEFDKM